MLSEITPYLSTISVIIWASALYFFCYRNPNILWVTGLWLLGMIVSVKQTEDWVPWTAFAVLLAAFLYFRFIKPAVDDYRGRKNGVPAASTFGATELDSGRSYASAAPAGNAPASAPGISVTEDFAQMWGLTELDVAPILLLYPTLPQEAGSPDDLPADIQEYLQTTFQPYQPPNDDAFVKGYKNLSEGWQKTLQGARDVADRHQPWDRLSADERRALSIMYIFYSYKKYVFQVSIRNGIASGDTFKTRTAVMPQDSM